MTTATEISAALPKAAEAVARIEALDWQEIGKNLDEQGNAALASVLTPQECKALASLYPNEDGFRSRVVMERHGFGRGEYKYFSYPLPDIIEGMRTELYSRLAPLANKWNESMKIDVRYPAKHAQFIKRCHDAGQERPTPLLLQYGAGDFNCLHQDLYGEHNFIISGKTSSSAGSPPSEAALAFTMIMNRILSNLHRCVEPELCARIALWRSSHRMIPATS